MPLSLQTHGNKWKTLKIGSFKDGTGVGTRSVERRARPGECHTVLYPPTITPEKTDRNDMKFRQAVYGNIMKPLEGEPIESGL